mgnify:CR=1 FL=1
MNQTRTFLLIAWLAVAFLLFMEWGKGPAPATVAEAPVAELPEPSAALPDAGAVPDAAAVPDASAVPDAAALPPVAGAAPATAAGPASPGLLRVRTDVLDLRVDLRGGSLVGAELSQYPVDKDEPARKVRLFDADAARFSVAQSGLVAQAGSAPSHEAVFRPEGGRTDFQLADGQDTLEVPLLWTDPATGLQVRKTWVLTRGSYALTLREEVINDGTAAWRGYGYQQLIRVPPVARSSGFALTNPEAYSFTGGAWYSPAEKFDKRKYEDFVEDGPLNLDVTGGWIAMLQHHFLVAWVPAKAEPQRFSLAQLGNGQPRFLIRAVGAPFEVAPGTRGSREATLWVGPKLQEQLQDVAPGMKLTLDYGIFTFLAQPMFDYVLEPLHDLTGNWGWAIILTVLIIKLVLYPLSAKQYQSFAKMRAIQPRIESLKERYGDDKQKFQMAMMELYKKEKINPIGGCLPILVTIPVFIALYWMLLESVEMRQAPWMGWIDNLTAPDPYFILPAINLAVMYLTQKMTPTPGMDPMQKKMMTAMPLIFGVMMAFFPSGLVLYWCTNGILGLAQQWIITKRHGTTPAPAK